MSRSEPQEQSTAPDGKPASSQPAWRRAFPVDVPQDNYVGRRDFTKFVGLTSLAFVAGQFWIVAQSWLRKRRGSPHEKEIAHLNDIPVGGAITFSYPEENDRCILVRPDEKTLLAYDQKCTHLSCAVTPQVAQGCLHCPCHHGVFDLTTGRPISGPPRRPLPRVSLEVRDDTVVAVGVEYRTV